MLDQVIINADDFGWTDGHNLAVERAHRFGVLNRVSLMANGESFVEAVKLAKRMPNLGVGIHLTLNEGYPILRPQQLPNLTQEFGSFHDSIYSMIWLWSRGHLQTDEALHEWRAQIDHALKAGIQIRHIDSHKHVHILPPLLETVVQLAKEYRINYVRSPLEKLSGDLLVRGFAGVGFWMLARRAQIVLRGADLQFAERFASVGASGRMTSTRLKNAIREARGAQIEIMVHPAVMTDSIRRLRYRYRWAARYQFEDELQAICDQETIDLVERRRFEEIAKSN